MKKFLGPFFQKGTASSPRWASSFLFLSLALPLGLFLAIRVPLGHVPDESNHALRAESLLHGSWIGKRGRQDGHPASLLLADPTIIMVVTLPAHPMSTAPEPITPGMQRAARAVTWSRVPWLTEAGSIAGYMPLFYVPGAVAVAVAKWLGGGPSAAFLAIRLTNLLCFAVIGAASLRLAVRGVALIACTLLLPMTLGLAASCSQDGLLIACAALAVVCITRAQVRPYPAARGWLTAAGCLLALVIGGKPPYAPLALLLLVPVRTWRVAAQRSRWVGLVMLPGLLWSMLEAWLVAVPVSRPLQEAGPLWPGRRPALFAGTDFVAQLHVLAVAPWRMVTLPLLSIARDAGARLHEMVGVLDYLSLVLPDALYCTWFAALAASFAACAGEPAMGSRSADRLLAAASLVLAVCGVGTALYVQWTPVGVAWVGGLQGRYFLPLLPGMVLILPQLFRAPVWLRGFVTIAAVTDVLWLPGVVRAFYPD